MTVTDDESTADTTAPPVSEQDSSALLFGPGQAAWLAVVTVAAVVALVVSFVALVIASNDSGGGTTAATSGPVTELTVSATEFAFDPDSATVAADTDVTVTLENAGSIEHNWAVLAAGERIAAESELDESMIAVEVGPAAGAGSASGTVNLAAGSYQVICTIAGHYDAGMEAELVVGA